MVLKSTFKEVWAKETNLLDETCQHKFRNDSSINQYVMKLWQIYSGNFTQQSSKNIAKCITLSDNINHEIIKEQKANILCINDGNVKDIATIEQMLINSLDSIFLEKSTFEK